MSKGGSFIISLDFELHWGIFDHTPLTDTSRAYFDRARRLIPPTLELFERHGIRATWATVGMLLAEDRTELLNSLPDTLPQYRNPSLSAYRLLDQLGQDEADDPYHFALSLAGLIGGTPGQELGSHTFAHYYCLEPGQNEENFDDDLRAAQVLAERRTGHRATALVFPRNQCQDTYFERLPDNGFSSYRGNPPQWYWQPGSQAETTKAQRGVRLVDHYFAVGSGVGFKEIVDRGGLYNVPASRFFRPYQARIDGYGGQRLKIRRILSEMERAAANGHHYHLWWHPHNLASHPTKNMMALGEILAHFTRLRDRYGWRSDSMESLVARHNRDTE